MASGTELSFVGLRRNAYHGDGVATKLWKPLFRSIVRRLRLLSRGESVTDAREPVMAWYRQVRQADWAKPADVKRDVRSASILRDGRVVFNIAGNKYRIVVWINNPYRVVYIRFVGSHRQYDAIDAQSI
jgi:mRNA interferase HigB